MSVTTPDRQLTFGEELCRVNFNPSKDPRVDEVKKMCAHMADLVNGIAADAKPTREVIRMKALGDILDAQMTVVKLITL